MHSLGIVSITGPAASEDRAWARRVAVGIILWALGVAALGILGIFAALPLKAFPGFVAAGILVPVLLYGTHPGLRSWLRRIELRHLTVFQLWRIPAAVVFFWYGAHGLLPEAFVRNAAWGDLVAGLLVLPVLALPPSRASYLAFNLFGFADFALAVGTGLTLSLVGTPAMATIATFPIVLIPLFGVGLSGAAHVVSLDRLLRARP